MATKDITELFSDPIRRWRAADSQRAIFGVEMPQTQRAIDELITSLDTLFKDCPTFSFVLKDQAMEIIVRNDQPDDQEDGTTHIPVHLPSLPKVFKELNINSITIESGVTNEEVTQFFSGLGKKPVEIEQLGGFKGFMKKQGVKHIKIDQMKFELLKDDEQITAGGSTMQKLGEMLGSDKGKASKAINTKQRNALWKNYLEGTLDKNEFSSEYEEMISEALKEPKQLENLLKRLMKKEKETDKFLSHIEEKLSEVGFGAETVDQLKKKLYKPKKVMVPEDELARLRKIEKDYHAGGLGPGEGADDAQRAIKTIKKKLTDERKRSEALLHQLSQGGIVLDKKGNILSVNATAQKVLGCHEKEIQGQNIKNVLKPHHILTTVTDWQKETDDHTPSDVTLEASNEEAVAIVRESSIVVENEHGRSIGLIAALHDVTQQEELNKRKNDILDVLGHDLRAPLGAIKQNFDVLIATTNIKSEGNERQIKFVDNCKNSITRMSKLIEKIMDMRQLETGKINLKYDIVETSSLIEQAAMSQLEWAQNKNITINVKADNLPNIDGDPERLYQIITNLVSNALKFTPEGGTITAEGRQVNDEGVDCMQVSVTDTGMGIDAQNLKRIFDKYEQVTVNTPKGVSGLGLGLSICKTIIELHGGKIWAESQIDAGSTFTFQVPVKHVND